MDKELHKGWDVKDLSCYSHKYDFMGMSRSYFICLQSC